MVIGIGIGIFAFVVAILIIVFLRDFREAQHLYTMGKSNNEKIEVDDSKIDYYVSELKRQKIIIDELKLRMNTIGENSQEKKRAESSTDILELARQKQILEQEKQIFQEKNKKLWNQSIAIHQEKDRIDTLRKEIETKHNEIVDSINYAKRIQNALVTSTSFLDTFLQDYFIFWRPRNVVSGDFYWAKQTNKGLLIVVADCTGHGVPGAFMSLLGISFLNEISARITNIEPSRLLEELRVMVKKSLRQNDEMFTSKDGMDMACALINFDERKIKFSGANNPMWIIRSDELIEFSAVKNPVGIFRKEKPFEQHELSFESDDVVFLFSDGYADQFGGKNNTKYKRANFRKFLLDISNRKLKMKSVGDSLAENFEEWKGSYSQTDDVIVMGIRL